MKKSRLETGHEKLNKLNEGAGKNIVDNLGDLGKYIVEFGGDIYSRDGLGLRERETATIAMLTVLSKPEQLKVHIQGGLNVGLTYEEIEEIIIHTAPYSGFPTAINAMNVLKGFSEHK